MSRIDFLVDEMNALLHLIRDHGEWLRYQAWALPLLAAVVVQMAGGAIWLMRRFQRETPETEVD